MNAPVDCDVLILGAGPAGSVAALELLQRGYRVVIVERSTFPRPQVGEALTPGVRDILRLVGAADALQGAHVRADLPTRRCWQSRDPELASTPHLMVDRGELDQRLLQLACERGALCLQPARADTIQDRAGGLCVDVHTDAALWHCQTRYVLDARGRRRMHDAVRTAPRLLSLWTELPEHILPAEIRIEAMTDAWLWGAPIRRGYRIMSFCDPTTPRRHAAGDPSAWLRATLQRSVLFADAARVIQRHAVHGCAGGPYRSTAAPRARLLCIGDAQFALDPLSSCGVEKAVRFALQAAVAVHTTLSTPSDEQLAREFLEARVHETVVQHQRWTRDAYHAAWPSRQHDFWRIRSTPVGDAAFELPLEVPDIEISENAASFREQLHRLRHSRLSLSPHTEFIVLPCVIGDRIRRHRAIVHPRLARPVAFLGSFALDRLLLSITTASDLGQWLSMSTLSMPPERALSIASWLLRHELVYACGHHEGHARFD